MINSAVIERIIFDDFRVQILYEKSLQIESRVKNEIENYIVWHQSGFLKKIFLFVTIRFVSTKRFVELMKSYVDVVDLLKKFRENFEHHYVFYEDKE